MKVAVIGYSGHAYVVLDACLKSNIEVSFYCAPNETLSNPFGLFYLGNEASDNFDWSQVDAFVMGVGDNRLRAKIAEKITASNKKLLNVAHPTSVSSFSTQVGQGNFFAASSVCSALSTIGGSCVINTGAIVEHECVLGDYVHLAPGAVLAGDVHVGKYTFIGANAVVKQGIRIGKNVTVGAGSVVIRDIPDDEVWAGNPATNIKK